MKDGRASFPEISLIEFDLVFPEQRDEFILVGLSAMIVALDWQCNATPVANHDAIATFGVYSAVEGLRWPMPMLQEAIRGR